MPNQLHPLLEGSTFEHWCSCLPEADNLSHHLSLSSQTHGTRDLQATAPSALPGVCSRHPSARALIRQICPATEGATQSTVEVKQLLSATSHPRRGRGGILSGCRHRLWRCLEALKQVIDRNRSNLSCQ